MRLRCFLMLMLLLAGGRAAKAAIETDVNRIVGGAIVNSASVSAVDNKYNYIVNNTATWGTVFSDQKAVGRVTLGFDQNSFAYVSTPYTAKVTVQIDYYTDAAPTTLQSFGNQLLVIDYNPLTSSLVNQTDRSVFELNTNGKIIRIKATIVSITDAGNTPMAAPANLFLETSTEVERYYALNLATVPSSSILALTPPSTSNANELTLFWGYIPGAEEYDVEWTYVNDYDAAGAALSTTPANSLQLDFAHNSTRVTVSGNSFGIPLLFDQGYLAVRIRPVGYAYDATSSTWKKVAGRWTNDNAVNTTLGAFN
ncbi:MAG: hypothetical protein M3R17_13810, partial [Bacteroidota bacterium]|nr:hypothetical protein [Bacteroidota bacterium]